MPTLVPALPLPVPGEPARREYTADGAKFDKFERESTLDSGKFDNFAP